MKTIIISVGLVTVLSLAGLIAVAQEEAPAEKPAAEPAPPPKKKKAPKADSLDALLRKVKGGWKSENVEVQKRENYFKNAKSEQAALLQKAQGTLAAVQRRSEILEKEFDENKLQLTKLEKTLKERLGTMNELFGVVRQVVADTRGQVDMSLISAQYPGRGDSLAPLAEKTELPSVEQLEELWYVLQHEMTESGKVVRFPATVITTEGKEENQEVIRIGVFNAIADNKFFTWDDKLKKLTELGRQPPSRFLSTASDMQEAKSGFVKVAVDPSSGQILSLLVRTPGFKERIEAGGMIGYFIIGLGILALFLALVRFAYLTVVSVKVQKQRTSTSISNQNPLGRVINIYEQNPDADVETLELKLDEAILRESNKLERLLWLVKIVSVVAPLMGLLGTVTGMIRTFQAITLFGTGDPKMMASGISEALVTTMLGLMVAIPLVLSHSALRSMSKRVIDMLEEQSAGVIAKRVEQLR